MQRESAQLVKDCIKWTHYNKDTAFPLKAGAKIAVSRRDVRWVPTKGILERDAQRLIANGVVIDTNDSMFAAYGGARISINGQVVKVQHIPFVGWAVDLKVDVTFSDTYTFTELGPKQIRLAYPTYEASYLAEVYYKQGKKFDHSVSLTNQQYTIVIQHDAMYMIP